MTFHFGHDAAVRYLQTFITHNKARGMVAELALDTDLQGSGSPDAQKMLNGAWLLSPHIDDYYNFRNAVFVLPVLFENGDEMLAAIRAKQNDRGFQALATFLEQSGMGILVAAACATLGRPDPQAIEWRNFIYRGQVLHAANGNRPFDIWPGSRGRASKGNEWQPDVLERFSRVNDEQLTALTLRQAFFYGYLKQQLKKPVCDPYDVDAFIVGFRGAVMPVEVKEKSPTPDGAFGLDAGRILMMLRLCLATDSNAMYLIREIGNADERSFVSWRYITLSNLIMGCSWNLQAGGPGMGGGQTQTVMMPGTLFGTFDMNMLSEDWLRQNSSLQGATREAIQRVLGNLSNYLITE